MKHVSWNNFHSQLPLIMHCSLTLIYRLDEIISEMERERRFERWLPSHEDYTTCERLLRGSKNEKLLLQLWRNSQRRSFLLKLKSKYSGM